MVLSYQQTLFLKSAARLKDFPPDIGREVAFVGRSNSGKSTAINVITGIKKLAKTSKTPGRTQLINFFPVNKECCLVDLPGYGYANVPNEVKARWEKTIATYLTVRKALRGLILIMDIRHPLKPSDEEILQFAEQSQLAVHILLTKADKLSRLQAHETLRKTIKYAADYSNSISVQVFSALQKTGVEEARQKISDWFVI
jgi:GTP-binding protein